MTEVSNRNFEVRLARLLPWLRILRAVGLSIAPKKLFLAVLGMLALNAGWEILGRAFSPEALPAPTHWLGVASSPAALRGPTVLSMFQGALWDLSEPIRKVFQPFFWVFAPRVDLKGIVGALIGSVWAVCVWGIVGGAIARVTMVQLAQGEHIGMGTALRFAFRKWLPLAFAPLCPFLAVALFVIPNVLFGLLFRIPGDLAQSIAQGLLIFPILAGLVISIILLGLAAGWPLIVTSVAAEGEDGFDALSRSYAYVFQRPLYYAFDMGFAWMLGLVGLVFVLFFQQLLLHLVQWSLSFTVPPEQIATLFAQPQPVSLDPFGIARGSSSPPFWLSFVNAMVHGWIYSYFWSAASLIYLHIRQEVDGTSWREVALPTAPVVRAAPSRLQETDEAKPAEQTQRES